MSPGARGSAFGLTALGLASLGVRYFKNCPFRDWLPLGFRGCFFLASLISTLYHGTCGRDLIVLVTTGACRSRVFDNVVLYKLTNSWRLSGQCWHRADFRRSLVNNLMLTFFVFLYIISLTVTDGSLISYQITDHLEVIREQIVSHRVGWQ